MHATNSRAKAYSDAMKKVYEPYPDDHEAAAFYALSLLASEPHNDETFANRRAAAAVREMKRLSKHFTLFLIAVAASFAQNAVAQEPRTITYCELARDPGAHNHELVRITAFVTHGFEDFTFADPTCLVEGFSVWLMYGGTAESNTVYCCPGESGKQTRNKPLTIEGIEIPLTEDAAFQSFKDLLKKEPDTVVRATLVGRFFSGEKRTTDGKTLWGGAGHLGCCSLLVIERLESFVPHTRTDLDYSADEGWYEDEGCKWGSMGYKRHVSIQFATDAAKEAIDEQRAAESTQTWAFSEPHRVAMESLKRLYPGQSPTLRRVKKTAARQVFRWRDGKKSIVVVVIRPYWLSFYSSSEAVAWIAATIKEAECR